MEVIDPKNAPNARPLDDLLQECEEAAVCDLHRLPDEKRVVFEQLAEVSKKNWRSMFAFRGQSRMYLLKIRSPQGVGYLVSLHSSGYRFVHDLDWTGRWWPDASGQTSRDARVLYHTMDGKATECLEKLARWRLHLLRHPLTQELAEAVEAESSQRFRDNPTIQELFPNLLLRPEQNRELHRAAAEAQLWSEATFGSLGQHYGIPSQYLDLTYSPKVAARFALNDNWHRVLNGERVYGCLMSFILPGVFHRAQEFREKWAAAYPVVVDISWIPARIAKRPSLQDGLSLSNSPSPNYGPHMLSSNWVDCAPFYTVPCREMEEIAKMNLTPGDDPFLEVVDAFRKEDEGRHGIYFD